MTKVNNRRHLNKIGILRYVSLPAPLKRPLRVQAVSIGFYVYQDQSSNERFDFSSFVMSKFVFNVPNLKIVILWVVTNSGLCGRFIDIAIEPQRRRENTNNILLYSSASLRLCGKTSLG